MDGQSSVMYIDRAVQTEPPRHLTRLDNAKFSILHDPEGTVFSPLTISKRDHQLSQLSYSKTLPSNFPPKRIVSLPETSPPSRIKLDTVRDRIVSMSEQHKTSLAPSEDNSVSSDCFESSIDASQAQDDVIGVANSNSARSRFRHSLVFPQTPSPPSSPESVMIIGNNVQVPNSFLRQKASKLVDVNDSAWMTWSSSPPRPIPALHGPLSLPYARCPSGAEGTINDGEDITRTIWGLGNDISSKGDHSSGIYLKYIAPPSAKEDRLSPAFSPGLTRFTHLPQRQSKTSRDLPENGALHVRVSSIISGIDVPRVSQDLSEFKVAKSGDLVQGLGLVWSGSDRVTVEPDSPVRLKASAPEFVPSGQLYRQSPFRIPVDPLTRPYRITPQPALPTIDLSCLSNPHLENQTPHLESPKSTSTTWTPYLPTPLPLHTERLVDVWNSDEAIGELRRFVSDRVGQQNLSPFELKQISELIRTIHLITPAHADYGYGITSPDFIPSHASPTLDVELHRPCSSPERPGNLTLSPKASHVGSRPYPQPRSVPFARLIQRQLTVVPEEPNHIPKQFLVSPRIGRTAFGGNADAYKPYFAHSATQQQISRLPDISNQASGASSRPHNSRDEHFTASTLEADEYVSRSSLASRNRIIRTLMQDTVVSDTRDRQRKAVRLSLSSGASFGKENSGTVNAESNTIMNSSGKDRSRKKFKPKKPGHSAAGCTHI
ncbi:hypothetical protein D9757_000762 [Collybiopsis confluens]|uniref:Uncharacterized protein n=1 Tax=Collybiopsis confluens TaxID=2823264 RepID=A0A8H5I0Z2_9AGAR|nr:hypothetical protein D9757_000762 [Collybiopsis confluens]